MTRDNGCDFVLSVLHIYREVGQKGVRLKETATAAAKNRSWEGLCRTFDRLGNNSYVPCEIFEGNITWPRCRAVSPSLQAGN